MKRWARPGMALGAMLSLAACWTGEAWFTASDAAAVAVIPDGSYRLAVRSAPSETADHLRIRRQTDRSLLIDGTGTPWRAIVVPLGARGSSRFLVQLQEQDADRPTHALFVLLDTAGGRYRIGVLGCGEAEQAAVEQSEGFVARDPQTAAICAFHDRATLLTRMRAAANEEPALDLELVKDRQ